MLAEKDKRLMPSPTMKELVKSQQTILTIIWIALTFSIAVYAALALFFAGKLPGRPPGVIERLEPILYFAALAPGLVSFFLWRSFQSSERIRTRLAGRADDSQPAADDGPEKRLSRLARTYTVSCITGLALNESVAMMGLVFSLWLRQPRNVLPFAAVAAILNLIMFPRLESFVNRAAGGKS
jgi:hypothetical protein